MTASGDFFRGEDSSQDESSSQCDSMDSSSQCDSQEESSHVGEESFNSGNIFTSGSRHSSIIVEGKSWCPWTGS